MKVYKLNKSSEVYDQYFGYYFRENVFANVNRAKTPRDIALVQCDIDGTIHSTGVELTVHPDELTLVAKEKDKDNMAMNRDAVYRLKTVEEGLDTIRFPGSRIKRWEGLELVEVVDRIKQDTGEIRITLCEKGKEDWRLYFGCLLTDVVSKEEDKAIRAMKDMMKAGNKDMVKGLGDYLTEEQIKDLSDDVSVGLSKDYYKRKVFGERPKDVVIPTEDGGEFSVVRPTLRAGRTLIIKDGDERLYNKVKQEDIPYVSFPSGWKIQPVIVSNVLRAVSVACAYGIKRRDGMMVSVVLLKGVAGEDSKWEVAHRQEGEQRFEVYGTCKIGEVGKLLKLIRLAGIGGKGSGG